MTHFFKKLHNSIKIPKIPFLALTSVACCEGELRKFPIESHGSPPAPFGICSGGLFNNVDVVPCDRCIISLANRETGTLFLLSHARILLAISAGFSEVVSSPGSSADSTVSASGSVDENL